VRGGIFSVLLILITSSFWHQVWVIDWNLFFWLGKILRVVFVWDNYSFIFSITVLFISSIIFLFTFYYIDREKRRVGFTFLLSLFVLSMLFLVTRPNLFFLLLGWDGLGLTSYILVVYYRRRRRSVAGIVTFLTNRLGDIFFLFGISFLSFFYEWEEIKLKSVIFLRIILFLAFITKRAQVPFSSWLPAAIAAPTPVSSLVHSSTLVTAGVFLLIRFNYVIFPFSFFLLMVRIITLLLAGIIANFEWDLKKLIAYSTLRQLGFIIITFSTGLTILRFFHLVTHAIFKASLFISAGLIIHRGDNRQEFRNSFNTLMVKPFISLAIFLCLLCLSGIPFTSGFFSKDIILDGTSLFILIFGAFLVGVILTIIYSLRFFVFIFKKLSLSRSGLFLVYENVIWVWGPIWGLLSISLLLGFFLFEIIFSLRGFLIVSMGWKVFYFIAVFFISFFLFRKIRKPLKILLIKKHFMRSMWFLNKNITRGLGKFWIFRGYIILGVIDGGWLEFSGPQGRFIFFREGGNIFFRLQRFLFFSYFVIFIFFFILF
jgi:NADH-ubiquinone oxidoreductase chain 5